MKNYLHKGLAWMLTLCMMLALLPVSALAGQPDTEDTTWYNPEKNTYTLTDAGDLLGMVRLIRDWDHSADASRYPTEYPFYEKTILLGNDIRLTAAWPSDQGSKGFAGVFDGKGYAVENFWLDIEYKSSNSTYGFFSKLLPGGAVKNLTITIEKDFSVAGTYGAVAGYAGGQWPADAAAGAQIENCRVIMATGATVRGEYNNTQGTTLYASGGGLVGSIGGNEDQRLHSSITDCSVTGKFDKFASFGGIAGDVSGNVTLKNLRFDGEITGTSVLGSYSSYGWFGGIFAKVFSYKNAITVENCYTTGKIDVTTYGDTAAAGGVAGYVDVSSNSAAVSQAVYKNLHSAMDINLTVLYEEGKEQTFAKKAYAGGLIGYGKIDSLSGSSASGNVEIVTPGRGYAGGLAGYLTYTRDESDLTVSGSKAEGNVTNNSEPAGNDTSGIFIESSAGGLIGGLASDQSRAATGKLLVEHSYATGNVAGRAAVGGLIGRNGDNYYLGTAADIDTCYATGTVKNLQWTEGVNDFYLTAMGGLVGWHNGGDITASYATGKLDVDLKYSTVIAGGLIGRASTILEQRVSIGKSYGENEIVLHVPVLAEPDNDGNQRRLTGGASIGGLAGLLKNADVSNSYAKPDVSAKFESHDPEDDTEKSSRLATVKIAGFVQTRAMESQELTSGLNISNCYAAMVSQIADSNYAPGVDGFAQKDVFGSSNEGSSVTDCLYLDSDMLSGNDPDGEKTKIELQRSEAYTGWDADVWNIPTLSENEPAPGENAPYATLKPSWTETAISEITASGTISVPMGTPFARLMLPLAVTGTADAERAFVVSQWSGTYDENTAGDYVLTGAVLLDGVTTNASAKTATITVRVVPELRGAKADGTLKAGEALAALAYGDTDLSVPISTGSFSYRWQIADAENGTFADIADATGSSYTLVSGDVDKYLRVAITMDGKTVTSAAVGPVEKNSFTTAPEITALAAGTDSVKVSFSNAAPHDGTAYVIYYKQSDTPITEVPEDFAGWESNAGVTGKSITDLTTDKGYYFVVKASRAGYNDAFSGVGTAMPTNFPTDENTTISSEYYNDIYPGETQTYTASHSNPAFTYLWERLPVAEGENHISITGASDGTAVLVKGDALGQQGLKLTVTKEEHTGTATVYIDVNSAFSLEKSAFTEQPQVGKAITASPERALLEGAAARLSPDRSYAYQWMIGDDKFSNSAEEIDDAADVSYTPTGEDGAKHLFVKVTMTNNGVEDEGIFYAGQVSESDPEGTLALSAAIGSAKVTLTAAPTFTQPAEGQYTGKGYTVYYREANAQPLPDYAPLTGAFDTAEMEITALDYGKMYEFYVTIKADGYNPLKSNTVQAALLAPLHSVTITNSDTVNTAISAQFVFAQKNASDPGTMSVSNAAYQWQRSETGSDNWVDIEGAEEADYTLTGEDYQKYVRLAVTGDQVSTTGTIYSEASHIVNAAEFETMPAITSAEGTDGTVTLSWTPSVPAAESYSISGGTTTRDLTEDEISTGTIAVDGLTNGTNYNFTVTAKKLGYSNGTSSLVTAMPFINASSVSVRLDEGAISAEVSPPGAGPVSYMWTVNPQGAVTFASPTEAETTYTPVLPGEHLLTVTVTNRDGTTVTAFETIQVENSEASLITFGAAGYFAEINGTEVTLVLPYGTELTTLVPVFTVSYGASVAVGGTSQVSGETQNDFTQAVTYTVTSQDDKVTEAYTVTVSLGEEEVAPLDTPDPSTFVIDSDGIASWDSVTDAGGYRVQLYLNGLPVGSLIETSENQCNILDTMKAPGTYSISVAAAANSAGQMDSMASAAAGSFIMRAIVSIEAPGTVDVVQNGSEPLPAALSAVLSDGSTYSLPITWEAQSRTSTGLYMVRGVIGDSLAKDVINYNGVPIPVLPVNIVPRLYVILATAGSNGSITPPGNVNVAEGGSRTFVITPDPGYRVSSVLVDEVDQGPVTQYSFRNVRDGHTIHAAFKAIGGGPIPTPSPDPDPGTGAGTSTGTDDKLIKSVAEASVTTDATGKSSASISNAQADALVKSAKSLEADKKGATIEIKIGTPATSTGVELSLSKKAFNAIAAETAADLKITTGFAEVTFDTTAAKAINKEADGDITISVQKADISALSEQSRSRIGDRPVYDLSVKAADTAISDFGGGTANISIPYAPKAGEDLNAIVVYYIGEDGVLESVRGAYNAAKGSVDFVVFHFSTYAVGYNKISFADVGTSAWYADAITFIAARGITTGTGKDTFSPNATLTRGQFITMLLRAYQIEADESPADNFSDAGSTYYTGHLAAAKRLGITKGVGENRFAPEQAITRQEMFTLLYNGLKVLNEVPEGDSEKAMSDFADSGDVADWAAEAMTALVQSGTVSGGNGKLDPTSTTTRAQMAQVLYNLLSK